MLLLAVVFSASLLLLLLLHDQGEFSITFWGEDQDH
jgi:hypothetical protein